jgi:hypothetical protein
MRHRRILTSVAVLTLLLTAGCGSDDKDQAVAPAPAGAVPATPAADPGVASPDPHASSAGVPGANSTAAPTENAPTGKSTGKPGRSGRGTTPKGSTSAPGAQLSASGLGPYQVAAARDDLKAAGLLGKVDTSAGCPDFVVAKGLPQYQSPALVFHQGKLQYTRVTSSKTATPAGAKVGMKLADVKKKYPAGKQLDDWNGAIAWFATTGGNALMFRFKDNKVESIEAGLAEPLQFRFTDGEGC